MSLNSEMSPESEPVLSPDAVVALAVAALSNSSSFDAAALRSNNATLYNGPTQALHERTIAVLDAPAELSISNQEVVAVALRIHEGAHEKPVPGLIISPNDPPTDTITAHLSSLWLLLRELSNEKFKPRFPKAAYWPALDMTEARFQNLYNQVFHEAYRHSYIKLQSRYNKQWRLLEPLLSRHRMSTQRKNVDKRETENGNEALFRDIWLLCGKIREMKQCVASDEGK